MLPHHGLDEADRLEFALELLQQRVVRAREVGDDAVDGRLVLHRVGGVDHRLARQAGRCGTRGLERARALDGEDRELREGRGLGDAVDLDARVAGDESREAFYRNVVSGFTQYTLAANVASKYVGGVVYVRDYAGSTRASYTPVDPARQREALKLVTDGLFQADSFRFRPEFLSRLAADPFEVGIGEKGNFNLAQRVLAVQTQVLDRLMSDATAARLLDSSLKTGDARKALSVADLYDTLQGAIWSDLKGTGDIPLMRRNLQREHVKRLAGTLTRPSGNSPADARALQRENARVLVSQLRTAQSRPGLSKEARAHIADSLNTLEDALKAQMQRAA